MQINVTRPIYFPNRKKHGINYLKKSFSLLFILYNSFWIWIWISIFRYLSAELDTRLQDKHNVNMIDYCCFHVLFYKRKRASIENTFYFKLSSGYHFAGQCKRLWRQFPGTKHINLLPAWSMAFASFFVQALLSQKCNIDNKILFSKWLGNYLSLSCPCIVFHVLLRMAPNTLYKDE